jgi:vitamin B12 transporter
MPEADGYPVVPEADADHGHRNTSLSARAAVDLGELDIELSHWQAQGHADYWSFGNLSQDFINQVTALTGRYGQGERSGGQLRVTRARDRIDQNEPNFLGELDYAKTLRTGLEWQHDYALDARRVLTLGVGWEQEDVQALSFGTRIDERNEVRSGFVQQDWEAGDHRAIAALRLTDHEAFGSKVTGNVDYGYRLSPGWRWLQGRVLPSARRTTPTDSALAEIPNCGPRRHAVSRRGCVIAPRRRRG